MLLVQLQTLLSWYIGGDKIKQNSILVKLIKTGHTQVAWDNCCHYGEYIVNSSVFYLIWAPEAASLAINGSQKFLLDSSLFAQQTCLLKVCNLSENLLHTLLISSLH